MQDLKNKLKGIDREIKILNDERNLLLEGTDLKKCSNCLEYKDVSQFPKGSKKNTYCKKCFNEYQKERRKAIAENRSK